jgi:hypothetical protein
MQAKQITCISRNISTWRTYRGQYVQQCYNKMYWQSLDNMKLPIVLKLFKNVMSVQLLAQAVGVKLLKVFSN